MCTACYGNIGEGYILHRAVFQHFDTRVMGTVALAKTQKNRSECPFNGNVIDGDIFTDPAIYSADTNTADSFSLMTPHVHISLARHNLAICKSNILKSTRRFGSGFQRVTTTADNTTTDQHIFSGVRAGTFQADPIIQRVDFAVENFHITGAVDINPIIASPSMIPDGDPFNMHPIAIEIKLHPHS